MGERVRKQLAFCWARASVNHDRDALSVGGPLVFQLGHGKLRIVYRPIGDLIS